MATCYYIAFLCIQNILPERTVKHAIVFIDMEEKLKKEYGTVANEYFFYSSKAIFSSSEKEINLSIFFIKLSEKSQM